MAEPSRNRKYRIVHYVNQFFGGVGGEEKADCEPFTIQGPQGPGRLFEKMFREQDANVEIVATVVCGDSYFADHQEKVLRELIPVIRGYHPDLVVAGPAFNAGRYGMACGAICQALGPLGVPAITAMYKENPGLDQYRKTVLIIETTDTVSGMEDAVRKMVRLGIKKLRGEEIEFPKAEGCFEQGIRKNYFHEEPAYRRAIDMLLRKINEEPFETEYPIPFFDRVEPRPALTDLKGVTIAFITSGGIVPTGNGTSVDNSRKFAKEIAVELIRDGVQAVILTST